MHELEPQVISLQIVIDSECGRQYGCVSTYSVRHPSAAGFNHASGLSESAMSLCMPGRLTCRLERLQWATAALERIGLPRSKSKSGLQRKSGPRKKTCLQVGVVL